MVRPETDRHEFALRFRKAIRKKLTRALQRPRRPELWLSRKARPAADARPQLVERLGLIKEIERTDAACAEDRDSVGIRRTEQLVFVCRFGNRAVGRVIGNRRAAGARRAQNVMDMFPDGRLIRPRAARLLEALGRLLAHLAP